MIHLYTGCGQGKTSAAVGLAARSLGPGRRVVFAQFLKGGPSGEIDSLRALGAMVLRAPRHDFWWNLGPCEKAAVARENDELIGLVLERCRSESPPDLVVLDEFTYVHNTPMADENLAALLVKELARRRIEAVFTGREAGPLAEIADYHSDISEVRHPSSIGCPPREGVEF